MCATAGTLEQCRDLSCLLSCRSISFNSDLCPEQRVTCLYWWPALEIKYVPTEIFLSGPRDNSWILIGQENAWLYFDGFFLNYIYCKDLSDTLLPPSGNDDYIIQIHLLLKMLLNSLSLKLMSWIEVAPAVLTRWTLCSLSLLTVKKYQYLQKKPHCQRLIQQVQIERSLSIIALKCLCDDVSHFVLQVGGANLQQLAAGCGKT